MARETVEVTGTLSASPEAAWAIVSDFAGKWHPAIATIRAEHDAQGSLIRAFTVHGEDTVYRERLTWLSHSDRTLGYRHLQGIRGADAYDARISIQEAESGGSTVRWSAVVAADGPRLRQICEGTRSIFEAGLAALRDLAGTAAAETAVQHPTAPTHDVTIEGEPQLALTVTPTRTGPLCLFLHGIGGARGNWLPQLAAAGAVMRSAALDLRGYGGSALGPKQSTVDDHCDDILRVKETLGAERLVLVGLSFGSWIATSFAMRHPEMLAGLVLSGGCTGMSEAGPEEREAFRTSRQAPLAAGRTPADFAPAVVEVLAGPDAPEAVRSTLLSSMAAIPSTTYADALACFTNPPERFVFSRLTMPVLMMTGEHDRLASPAEIRGVANRILAEAERPDVRYETIGHAGHVCNVEQPEAFNRLLLDFLRRLPR
ncbi:alpha/beta fold hydrolase [Aquibium microcysteis]|uniref:alpha/beta fold hydrolase n=1 Tax=Aquibium microcysteis TaxID=675281 RepID=UPI00165D1083|nr:alpha/beta fold hydrolase [Aquibium microcysteis]